MESLIDEILQGEPVRKPLSDLRSQLKDDPQGKELCIQKGLVLRLVQLLESADGKTRKNAALLLGELSENITDSGEIQGIMQSLWEAFEREDKKFVRSSYIHSLAFYPAREYVSKLQEILTELNQKEIPQEDLKHTRELRREIEKLLSVWDEKEEIPFRGITKKHGILLTAEPYIQENLCRELKKQCNLEGTITKRGVRVVTDSLKKLEKIPLYRELWFVLRRKEGMVLDRDHLPEGIANSELLPLLREVYGDRKSYTFRLTEMMAKQTERQLSLKQLAFQLEETTGHKLVNSGKNAQVEVKICPKADGTFALYGRFAGCLKERFDYHRETLPTAMSPVTAAQMVELIAPYLTENAHVLDPFCGQGNLLIERYRKMPARDVYGVDIYGEAIESARRQTERIGQEFYYINRDFFDFTTSYLMDEILTECPRMENKSREIVDEFYEKFFRKAIEVTGKEALIFVLSTEENAIKKQIRVHRELQLIRQVAMRGTEKIYIIKRKG